MTAFEKLGWIVAAAVLGCVMASGFQGQTEKFATVDLQTLVETSDFGKGNSSEFDRMKALREGLLQFIDDNRVLTVEQARDLRTLTLKENATADEKAKLERIKADVIAQSKRNQELSQKPNLTVEERTLLQEYASRSANMEQLLNNWIEEFRDEMAGWAQQRRMDTLKRAKEAAQAASKSGGYSLVFDSSVAVYAANDLTEEALKAMNAKK